MNDEYSKVAWCTELTTIDPEHFYSLKADGVDTCVINLTIGNNSRSLNAIHQIRAAKNANMMIHVSHIAEFTTPAQAREEAKRFMVYSQLYEFDQDVIHALIYRPNKPTKDASMLINTFQQTLYLEGYEEQDLCTSAFLIADNIVNISDLLLQQNLTVIDFYRLAPSIAGTGTWIFKDEYLGECQLIAYDFMDYYARAGKIRGRQLSLDTEYIARSGDTYWQIANQMGIPLPRLLMLNEANMEDRVIPGQRIKLI